MADASVHTWVELETDHPMDLISRERIIGKNVMISRVTLEAGFEVGTHQHENEQIAVVLEGKIRFGIGEPDTPAFHEETLVGGQSLLLPGNVPHRANAIERTIILDVFSPPSENTGVDK